MNGSKPALMLTLSMAFSPALCREVRPHDIDENYNLTQKEAKKKVEKKLEQALRASGVIWYYDKDEQSKSDYKELSQKIIAQSIADPENSKFVERYHEKWLQESARLALKYGLRELIENRVYELDMSFANFAPGIADSIVNEIKNWDDLTNYIGDSLNEKICTKMYETKRKHITLFEVACQSCGCSSNPDGNTLEKVLATCGRHVVCESCYEMGGFDKNCSVCDQEAMQQ